MSLKAVDVCDHRDMIIPLKTQEPGAGGDRAFVEGAKLGGGRRAAWSVWRRLVSSCMESSPATTPSMVIAIQCVTPDERHKGLDEAIFAVPMLLPAPNTPRVAVRPVTKLGARGPGLAQPGKRLRRP